MALPSCFRETFVLIPVLPPRCFHEISIGLPREFHGTSVDLRRLPWRFYETSNFPWYFGSVPTGLQWEHCPWESHGSSAVLCCGIPMKFRWDFHGSPAIFPYGAPMGLPRGFRGTSDFPWCFCGVPIGLFHGTSIVLPTPDIASSVVFPWNFHHGSFMKPPLDIPVELRTSHETSVVLPWYFQV